MHQKGRINVFVFYVIKICCVLQGRWRRWHLPVAMKAFLNSLSDSVPVFEMSVRKKMSCSKRRQFALVLWREFVSRTYGGNYEWKPTSAYTLYVVTFFQRRTNSSPFSLPVTDVCQLVREEIPCKLCAAFLKLWRLWSRVLHSCYIITGTLSKRDFFHKEDTSIRATMLWQASMLKPPDFKSPKHNQGKQEKKHDITLG